MASKAKVIHNPYAGRWLAQRKLDELKQSLSAQGIDFDLESTSGPGHGSQIAAQALTQDYSMIIAAGGDGTISEIINGMLKSAGDADPPPLGILPLGSANDLVINLGLPVDIHQAAGVIAAGRTRRIDIGKISHGQPPRIQYFDNNSAIGLEPTVTLIQQHMKRLRGILRYLVATIMGIMKNPSWEVQLAWEGGNYDGPCTLVTVGNCPLTGGLYMAPHADPFDGKLTFVHGYMSSRSQMLALLPRTMKPSEGSYVEHPSIHEIHSPWLKIKVSPSTPLHADGEIQTTEAREIEYSLLPSRMPVFLP